jgi:hypothetical protein
LDAQFVAGSTPGTSSDVEILAGTAPPVTLSSDSSAACLSKDDPNRHAFHDMPLRELVDEESEEDFPELPLPPKRTKKNYDLTRRFQMEWAATCPWNEMILTDEGLLHMVKCSICSVVRGRVVIIGPKFDTIKRHAKCIGHLKNIELYAARRPTSILQQIQDCSSLESRKRYVSNSFGKHALDFSNLVIFEVVFLCSKYGFLVQSMCN